MEGLSRLWFSRLRFPSDEKVARSGRLLQGSRLRHGEFLDRWQLYDYKDNTNCTHYPPHCKTVDSLSHLFLLKRSQSQSQSQPWHQGKSQEQQRLCSQSHDQLHPHSQSYIIPPEDAHIKALASQHLQHRTRARDHDCSPYTSRRVCCTLHRAEASSSRPRTHPTPMRSSSSLTTASSPRRSPVRLLNTSTPEPLLRRRTRVLWPRV